MNDEQTFYERLQLIADYKDDFERLITDIKTARSIVKNGDKLTPHQRKILDLRRYND